MQLSGSVDGAARIVGILGNCRNGPTGNLRAPTVRKGRMLIAGFDEGTYKRFLG